LVQEWCFDYVTQCDLSSGKVTQNIRQRDGFQFSMA